MSFVSITTGEITSGEPVASSTQTKIKNNFDDHETRIESLETFQSSNPAVELRVNGYYSVANGFLKVTPNFAMTWVGGRILVDQAGSSGTLQIDIKRSRSGGSYTSIFTTKPSSAYTDGNDFLTTNGVINPAMNDVLAGDIFRLDITSGQAGGNGFLVRLDYNRV